MSKEKGWVDLLSLGFSAAVIGFFAIWTLHSGFLTGLVTADQSMVWQFVRSSGLTAYILFTLSTLWGLALSAKIVQDWSPGTLSMLLHSSLSWLGVAFGGIHVFLLLFDTYVPYRPLELLIPFTGPYRPLAVGLGTLTLWIMLLVTLSFSIKKQLGHRRWKLLHYTSYVGFFLVTAHALFAGTDAGKIGFQLVFGLATLLVVVATVYRIRANKSARRPSRTR